MKNLARILAVAAAVVIGTLATPAQAGGRIFLAGDSNIFDSPAYSSADNEVFFQNVFNGESVASYSSKTLSGLGTTASVTAYGTGTAITSAGLAGHSYMLFGLSRSSVTAAELSAISAFHSAGGHLFLFGEGNTAFSSLNIAVNSILSTVGSSMSLSTSGSDNFDISGYTTLTSFTGTGPYAAGVSSWSTAYASKISVGSGTAVISGVADAGYFGTAVGLEDSMSAVPEPTSIAMWGFGALGACVYARRRKRRQA